MSDRRLEELVEAHLDDCLTPGEADELSQVLVTNPAARRQFWELAAVHGLAQEAARLEWLGTVSPQPQTNVVHVPWWRWMSPWAAAAAAVVALIFWWPTRDREESSGNEVAVLSRSVGAEWGEGQTSLAKGSILAPETLELKAGAVEIEFYTGARVVVEGPAIFRLVTAREGFLVSGKISAHVPPQARGFKIGSSRVSVVDYGTEFGFSVLPNVPEEVHVFRGRVEVTAGGGSTHQFFQAGEGVRVERGVFQGIHADESAFLSENDLTQHDDMEALGHFRKWKEASDRLRRDPDALVYYPFDPKPQSPDVLLNAASGANTASQGNIVGCTWTTGRWSGKPALNFLGEGDRVRVLVPQIMGQVTFLAWIRMDAWQRGLRSLISADTEETGALRWELTDSGRVRFSIACPKANGQADWEAINSKAMDTRNAIGQWQMVATTFDGTTVNHYWNGQLVGTTRTKSGRDLKIGTADIANLQEQGRRHFVGSMDELAVLKRALSQEEIQRFYESGKP